MQIIHLAFWRTATTGLQRIVFCGSGMHFLGVNAPRQSETKNRCQRQTRLLPFIFGHDVPEYLSLLHGDCILSDESGLIRMGGISAVEAASSAIRERFSDPVILLTVRQPNDLLQSAYARSEGIQLRAIGFTNWAQDYTGPPLPFDEWWRKLKRRQPRSLSGLLHYSDLVRRLSKSLQPERIIILPLEWLRTDPDRYAAELLNLGMRRQDIDTFIHGSPINARRDERLPDGYSEVESEIIQHYRDCSVANLWK